MNKDLIRFHLQEAYDDLRRTLQEISEEPTFGESDLFLGMQHVYHHLDTAWNVRDASAAEAEPGSEQFNRWGAFPQDLPLLKV